MREFSKYTMQDWRRGAPIKHAFRQIRNDISLRYYLGQTTPQLPQFLSDICPLAVKPLLIIVTFEQPKVLGWLLYEAHQLVQDAQFLVFDNSKRKELRDQIARACEETNTPYLGLPANRVCHVNRHHGMAMTWIYHNVIKVLSPPRFGFIDHDMIPCRPFSLEKRMKNAPVYGLQRHSKVAPRWSLWAGYCFFDFNITKSKPLNFLYDFAAGLDTGGRNWKPLFSHLEQSQIPVASSQRYHLHLLNGAPRKVQVIDGAWLHIGGISYNDAYRNRKAYFDAVEACRRAGTSWEDLLGSE